MKISFSDDEKKLIKSIGSVFKSGSKVVADATVAVTKTAAKATVTASKVAVKATAYTAGIATKGIADSASYISRQANSINSAIDIDENDFGLAESVDPEVLEPKQLPMRIEKDSTSDFEKENNSKVIDVIPVQVVNNDEDHCHKNDNEERKAFSDKSRNNVNNDYKEPDKITKKIIAKMFLKGATIEEVSEFVDLDSDVVKKVLDNLGLLE